MLEVKKFSANWCAPCRTLKSIFYEIQSQFDSVNFSEYDIDESYNLSSQYNVRSVPTVIFIKDGIEVERIVGLKTKAIYVNCINKYSN
jgi:thioredoxin 1